MSTQMNKDDSIRFILLGPAFALILVGLVGLNHCAIQRERDRWCIKLQQTTSDYLRCLDSGVNSLDQSSYKP